MKPTSEAAFEEAVEQHLLVNGLGSVVGVGFDRESAIFPETVLSFIRSTQPGSGRVIFGDRSVVV